MIYLHSYMERKVIEEMETGMFLVIAYTFTPEKTPIYLLEGNKRLGVFVQGHEAGHLRL